MREKGPSLLCILKQAIFNLQRRLPTLNIEQRKKYLHQETRFTLFEGGPAWTLGGSCAGTRLKALWYRRRNVCTAHFMGEVTSGGARVTPVATDDADFLARFLAARAPALRLLLRAFLTSPAGKTTSLLIITESVTRLNKMADSKNLIPIKLNVTYANDNKQDKIK